MRKPIFFILFIVISSLGLNFFLRHAEPSTDLDEYAWFYSSYYYELAFKKRDLHHSDWKSQDALDHPPLAKYLFGFVRSLQGVHLDNLDFKNWWFREADDDLRVDEFLEKNAKLVPVQLLFSGRLLSTLSFIGCAYLLWFIVCSFLSNGTALASVLVFCSLILIHTLAVQQVADGIFLFFLLFVILLQVRWVRSLREGKNLVGLSLLIGILSALLFLTKINGILSLGVFLLLGIFCISGSCPETRGKNFKRVILSGLVTGLTFTLVSYLLNPSFYEDPIGFVLAMFKYRSQRLALQQILFPTTSIPTRSLQISESFSNILIRPDLVYYYLGFPLLLVFFLIGLWRLPFSFSKDRPSAVVFFVNAFIWCGFIFYHYRMNWSRYLLVATSFFAVVMGMGAHEIVSGLRCTIARRRDFLIKIPVTIFLFFFFMALSRNVSIHSFKATHPSWVMEASIKTLLTQLDSQPDKFYNPHTLHSLAMLYHRKGDFKSAQKYHGQIMDLLNKK